MLCFVLPKMMNMRLVAGFFCSAVWRSVLPQILHPCTPEFDSDPIDLSHMRVVMQSGANLVMTCGTVMWFQTPKLQLVNKEYVTTLLQVELPVRAEHRLKGKGYLGLIADSSANKKRPLFMTTELSSC